eukprot:509418-Prymnesium_polylepis.1
MRRRLVNVSAESMRNVSARRQRLPNTSREVAAGGRTSAADATPRSERRKKKCTCISAVSASARSHQMSCASKSASAVST